MKQTRLIKFLLFALEAAIKEIRQHNADYHHRTSEQTLIEWGDFIKKARQKIYERYA